MSIYRNLEEIEMMACACAEKHKCNYNVILMNPDENGLFSDEKGSTYEFVLDSYFNKPRPNVILLFKTDDLI